MLRGAPGIERGNLMHAGNGAVRRAGLFGHILPPDVSQRVVLERGAGIASLLRAIVHQAVFADVEIARSGAAAPLVGTALRNIVLERIDASEAALFHRLHFLVDALFFFGQRLQLPAAVVDDSDGRAETERQGALADGERVLRITHATAHHGIDVHVEVRVFGQKLQLLVENFEALLGNLVGSDVINRNLKPFEAGPVQPLDAFARPADSHS